MRWLSGKWTLHQVRPSEFEPQEPVWEERTSCCLQLALWLPFVLWHEHTCAHANIHICALSFSLSLSLHNTRTRAYPPTHTHVFSRQGFSVTVLAVLEITLKTRLASNKLRDPPACSSSVVGLKAWTITAQIKRSNIFKRFSFNRSLVLSPSPSA